MAQQEKKKITYRQPCFPCYCWPVGELCPAVVEVEALVEALVESVRAAD